MFDNMQKDTISIYKSDGKEIVADSIKASVQTNKIFVLRGDILVEDNYIIKRTMSNGGEEQYRVLDAGFHEKFGSFEPHYQMSVEKINNLNKKLSNNNISINNSGNVIIGNDNTLNSKISSNTNNNILTKIDDLSKEIENLGEFDNKDECIEFINELKTQIDSKNQNKTVIKALIGSLNNTLPSIEKITNIISSISQMF